MLRRTKMSFLTVASICWISVNILSSLNLCYAWKPIVGAAYATSFALQQSHPEGESKIFSSNSHESKELSATSDIGFTLGNSHAGSSVGGAVPFSFHDEHFGYDDSFDAAAGGSSFGKEQCSVKKYAFNYDGTVRYNNEVPELNQFTICYWTRFTNHSGDHVILTYSAFEIGIEIEIEMEMKMKMV
ncbi:uncharacterized protein LOC119666464 [Teleopsis dalmanni]|uniref:uncharacterized protein LOC119666464 n=1 Tax=Teleopsis dalmanni TaxID=139649 RepID=UPI0018CD47DE|nr:uncharacterized protein LOC119666464 [Teleopsis dalmanni]